MTTAKVTKTYNRVIKTVIILAAAYFLYNQLFLKNTVQDLSNALAAMISKRRFLTFLIPVVLLMPVNWFLEALKWKQVVSAREKLSIGIALKAVFAGVTISSISVNRTGEFLGRIFVLKKYSFWEGAVVTIVGSYAQTFNTFFWGILSLFLLTSPYADQFNFVNSSLYYLFFLLAFLGLVLFLFFYYKISWLNKLVKDKYIRLRRTINILKLINNFTLNKVMILSVLRYFVFSLQFYLLMLGVSIEIPVFTSLMLISVMFLFNTIRPSIALIEIGLRSASALFVFELYYQSLLGSDSFPNIEIAAVTSFIWLINIVLPAMIGMVYIKDLRFFKKEKSK